MHIKDIVFNIGWNYNSAMIFEYAAWSEVHQNRRLILIPIL